MIRMPDIKEVAMIKHQPLNNNNSILLAIMVNMVIHMIMQLHMLIKQQQQTLQLIILHNNQIKLLIFQLTLTNWLLKMINNDEID